METQRQQHRAILPVALLLAAIAATAVARQPLSASALQTTTSPGGQFIAVGGDRNQRIEANRFAEEVRRVWAQLFGMQDPWQHPILLVFRGDQRRTARHPFPLAALTGDGDSLRFQIEISEPKLLGSPEMAAALFAALAAEYSARFARPADGKPLRLVPPWLIEAQLEVFLAAKNPSPVQIIEGLIESGRPPSIAAILRQRNLPNSLTERSAFRLLAFGLLRTLLEEPNGRDNARALLRRAAAADITVEILLAEFPSLAGEVSTLERKWILSLARMSHPARGTTIGMAETGRELRRLLDLDATPAGAPEDAPGVRGPAALPLLAREEGASRALMALASNLMRLETRAHPLYAPVIKEYREIVLQLARRPRANVRRRIEKNDELALLLQERTVAIQDFLNWYEMNRVASPDREFREILRLQDQSLDVPPRGDAISSALDAHQSWTR